MRNNFRLLPLLAASLLLAVACDDNDSTVPEFDDVPSVVVVNQGSMGYLAGSLDLLNLTDGTYSVGVSTLEGTPENVVECGGYLFVPQYEKNAVAVFDKSSLRAAGTIAVPAPQSVCTDGERVFAVGADSVFRISPATLAVEKKDTVGHTAYASVCAAGAVYVAIGQGMGQTEGGCAVAKVNPETLEREYIAVGVNPYNQMVADGAGNVFVICTGNYYDIPAAVYKVTPAGTASEVCGGTYIDVCGGTLYVVSRTSAYDADWNETSFCTYRTYDTATGALLASDFLATDAPHPTAATFVRVSPDGGDIYVGENGVTDGGLVSYTTPGSLYRFTASGALVERYAAGVNPYSLAFVTRRVVK